MSNTKDDLGIALGKYLCPVCGAEVEEAIIMGSVFDKKNAEKINKLHNKAIGFADHVCNDCAKYKDEGIFFIGINFDDSGKSYRTGAYACVQKDAELIKSFEKYINTLTDGSQICFIEDKLGRELKLWKDE